MKSLTFSNTCLDEEKKIKEQIIIYLMIQIGGCGQKLV